jgi:hypothetical protein
LTFSLKKLVQNPSRGRVQQKSRVRIGIWNSGSQKKYVNQDYASAFQKKESWRQCRRETGQPQWNSIAWRASSLQHFQQWIVQWTKTFSQFVEKRGLA